MQVTEAIEARRSIRKFLDKPVATELIEQILQAATLAPSGKNRQPWNFVVAQGDKKEQLISAMATGVEKMKAMGLPVGSAEWTMKSMRQSQVVILVYNPDWEWADDRNEVNHYGYSVDTQSVGAAIQNMLLQAEDLGLGTLWICDVFFAEQEINAFVGRNDELVAAVSIGYKGEEPAARPRKPWQELTTWL